MAMKPSYEEICTFCCEVSGKAESNLFYDLGVADSRDDYILAESEHFVVIPCIGALTDWYVLIVSRRHVLSVGWLNPEEQADLRELLPKVSGRLVQLSGAHTVTFEHGSYDFRDKGGACYDHAHIHVVATERPPEDFVRQLPQPVTMTECDDWIASALEFVTEDQLSYLALGSDRWQMIGHAKGAPSQFFRRALASWMGADDGEWDWLTFPQVERVKRMIHSAPLLGN